jgi:hypothetical protein
MRNVPDNNQTNKKKTVDETTTIYFETSPSVSFLIGAQTKV